MSAVEIISTARGFPSSGPDYSIALQPALDAAVYVRDELSVADFNAEICKQQFSQKSMCCIRISNALAQNGQHAGDYSIESPAASDIFIAGFKIKKAFLWPSGY